MKSNLMPGPLTGGAADNLGQEVLDAIERVLSAPEEVRILCAVTFLETVQRVRAIAEQDRALSIDSRFPGAYWERGRALAAKNDQGRAVADFNQMRERPPVLAAQPRNQELPLWGT
jgi:hypothetical protein